MTPQSRGKTAKTAVFRHRWQAWQVVRSIAAVRQRPRTPRNWRCSFAFFESFPWHFNEKQGGEVIFRLSRPVSCKNQENGAGKQWSVHAPLNLFILSLWSLILIEACVWYRICWLFLCFQGNKHWPSKEEIQDARGQERAVKQIRSLLVWRKDLPPAPPVILARNFLRRRGELSRHALKKLTPGESTAVHTRSSAAFSIKTVRNFSVSMATYVHILSLSCLRSCCDVWFAGGHTQSTLHTRT